MFILSLVIWFLILCFMVTCARFVYTLFKTQSLAHARQSILPDKMFDKKYVSQF